MFSFFQSAPHGVKVRVIGDDKSGYDAQCAICCSRVMPDNWQLVTESQQQRRFATFQEAKAAALKEHKSWINFYERMDLEKLAKKNKSNKVVWTYP
jgi:hypothetical protein